MFIICPFLKIIFYYFFSVSVNLFINEAFNFCIAFKNMDSSIKQFKAPGWSLVFFLFFFLTKWIFYVLRIYCVKLKLKITFIKKKGRKSMFPVEEIRQLFQGVALELQDSRFQEP